ncbi:hypothetical protein N7541_003358 [Penicillium brevicompactum]|uniref:SWR1-complex protein 3 domain-containing protein n=1 Tax=Penicillium brevicompactum TaxID=5074 RepID=A0A9W9UZR7_PENBR|nr:hypothetical protein N7541_003358 [Penicillium brevicompactum]
MAEKRKLPPRERREPAKRRVSEATPQSHRKKAPTPRAPSPVDAPLPTKIKDADVLPIVRTRQPENLSDKEYQSIAESAVLLTSLERSKKKWLSDGILVRYYTKPKKTKREQTEKKNPSKESMLKIGPCDVTIGPHLFDAMIYVVKDPNAPPSLQYTAPQRPPGVQWGVPHTPYRPYGSPSTAQRPAQYSPAPAGRPGYPGSQPSPQQNRPNQSNTPSSQGGQRPAQGQKGPNGQPAKPSPDPVIQMLATRAAADPDLKALMRVVASSQASQEQLRAFQAHIDELNAIIKSREQQEQRQQSATGTPTPAPQSQSTPQPPQKQEGSEKPTPAAQTPSTTDPVKVKEEPTPKSATPSQPKPSSTVPPAAPPQPATPGPLTVPPAGPTPAPPQQTPAIQPTPPAPAGTPQSATRPIPPHPSFQQPSYGTQPPIQSRPPFYGAPGQFPRPPPMPVAPPRVNYKSVVFEFTSPLTPYGSSTSGHAGSGDRYLFPEHTILEWLPAENTVIASFLIVRKVDPNTPFPLETATEAAAKSKAKGKGASKAKGDKKVKDEKGQQPAQISTPTQPAPTDTPQKQEPTDPATPGMPGTPSEANLKEYYQPVTFRIHAPNAKILEPLARVVKPADEVRKYMNEIMDRAERSPDGYLAMQLPHEQAQESLEGEGTPVSSGAGTRSRLSRVQLAEESEVESTGFEFEEEDEDDLKEFYDAPSGLAPMA